MSAVAKTIWMIESHFRETLSLDEMAAHAGVSRSHLSRIFPIATGYSISAYIRGRRLTEAAKELASGAPGILDVALDAGYGSHEAFSRAFREQFGITPDEARRRRSLNALQLVEAIRMDPAEKTRLAPPRIEDHPAIRLAGLNQRYTGASVSAIPDQWTRFHPFIEAMVGNRPGDSYAVVGRMEEGVDGFDYFVAIPLGAGKELLPGLTEMTIPPAKYARIKHEGHISQIRATCAAAFEDWLPASGYEADNTYFSFLEYYGPDFSPQSGLGTVEVWIALKR